MSDVDHEDEFDKAFAGFGEEPKQPETPPADPAKQEEPKPPAPEAPKVEEPKKDEQPKKPEEVTPPADTTKKPEEGAKPPEAPATPPAPAAPEEPKPLTEEGVTSIISRIRAEERDSFKEIDNTTKEVMDAYYPDGLSNVLTTPEGKALRTPQDVVDASNGEMTTEEAAQWLMNEQYKLDSEITKINNDAKRIAETTVSFKRDSISALQKYEPLFKWQPSLQKKVFDKLMQQVKADEQKGVILSAPDVMDHYDFYLEPYQKAYEFSQGQPGTNPVTPPAAAPPVTPGAEDRLDENGDGGASPVDDPNDFAQQVTKELAKGM